MFVLPNFFYFIITMSTSRVLPLLVNKLIIRHLVESTSSVNRKLSYLGVCHSWRQIALPLAYSTVYFRENCPSFWSKGDGWKVPDSSERLWVVNVMPFNAYDVACHAKEIDIRVHTHGGLFSILEMLERMFAFVPTGWKCLHGLRISIFCTTLYETPNAITGIESLVAFLRDRVPNIQDLDLRISPAGNVFDQLIHKIITGYSETLYSLRLSNNTDLGSSLSLKNVTVLDIDLYKGFTHILSSVEPQILQKLKIRSINWSYIWKYFDMPSSNNSQLEFPMLTDLYLEFSGWYYDLDSDSDHSSDADYEMDYISMVASALRSVTREWETDILERKIMFPHLQNLHVTECHCGSLFFDNCEFPRRLELFRLHDSVDYLEYSEWLVDNISSNNLFVQIGSGHELTQFKRHSVSIFQGHLGSRITRLALNAEFDLNPLSVNLPMLQRLHINLIDFKVLLALIPRLPSLRNLSLHTIHFNMPVRNGSVGPFERSGRPILNESVATMAADEISTSVEIASRTLNSCLKSLSIALLVSKDMEVACAHIKSLLGGLSELQVAVINSHHAKDIRAFTLEHKNSYPHFESMIIKNY